VPAESVWPAALAGVVFFILIVANARLRTNVPAADDPGREVLSFVARHHDRLQLGAVALGFAMPAALVWLSGLHRLLRTVEDGSSVAAITVLGGGILAAASTVTGALIEGTIAVRFADLGPSGARVAWTMFLMSTGATLLGLSLLIGATAAVSVRMHLFARWFTWASAALVLVSLVGAFTIGYSSDAIQGVAGGAVLLDSVWILLISMFMWRDSRHGPP
jgi:hypothetical protein